MKVLSVVCARANSKGLPNKCVVLVNGKMLIEYSIEYSLSLGSDVHTVVSTDIVDVLQYCERRGIACIARDAKLSQDETRIDDVLKDAIERCQSPVEYCSLVYGNIPTRYPELFQESLDFLEAHGDFDGAVSMQNVGKYHPDWMFRYSEDVLPREIETSYRRQDLSQRMIHDGHTVLFRAQPFMERIQGLRPYESQYRYALWGEKIKPMLNDRVIVDVDSRADLLIAEAYLAAQGGA